jgi:hypothetical protein
MGRSGRRAHDRQVPAMAPTRGASFTAGQIASEAPRTSSLLRGDRFSWFPLLTHPRAPAPRGSAESRVSSRLVGEGRRACPPPSSAGGRRSGLDRLPAEPKPGSSGAKFLQLGGSSCRTNRESPLDARRAAPLPDELDLRPARQNLRNFQAVLSALKPTVVQALLEGQGPFLTPNSTGAPQSGQFDIL